MKGRNGTRWSWSAVPAMVLVLSALAQASAYPAADEMFEDENWEEVCKAAVAQPLPEKPAQLEAQAASGASPLHPDCDEQQLYYGFERPPAYREALLCAYLHRTGTGHRFLNGAGTLAMLYANGDGVPRDDALAIRFACEADSEGGQNTEERVGRLEALRDGKLPPSTRFDVCDEQMSGVMGGYCEELTQRLADVKRPRTLAGLTAKLPRAAQMKLPALEKAEAAFEQARKRGEYTGGGGTGTAGFVELDQGQLREQFVINLQRFASGSIPPASTAVLQHAESAMRSAAVAAQNFTPDPQAWSMDPTPASLLATQQAWETLYGAWFHFIPLAYPRLSPDAAATELLRLRIHQLRKLAPLH